MLLRKRRVPVNAIPKDPGIVHPKDHAFSDSDYRRLADVKSESSLAKNNYRVACFLHYMADVLSVLHPDSFAEEVLGYSVAATIMLLPLLLFFRFSRQGVYPSCCFHCSDGGPKSKRYLCDRLKHVNSACYTGLLH